MTITDKLPLNESELEFLKAALGNALNKAEAHLCRPLDRHEMALIVEAVVEHFLPGAKVIAD